MEEKKENDKLRQNIKSLEERLAKIEKFLKPQRQEQEDAEEFLRRAIELTVQYDTVSASFLQRKLAIGYARACRLMDQMEECKSHHSAGDVCTIERVMR